MSEKNDTPPLQTAEGESLSRKPRTSCWGLSAVPKTSPGLRIKLKRPPKLTVSPPTTSAEDLAPQALESGAFQARLSLVNLPPQGGRQQSAVSI